jgi:hypothetical protein
MRGARITTLVALAMLVASCACGSSPLGRPAATAPSAGEDINVSGTLDRGPIATCPAGEPCDPPAVASAIVFTPGGGPSVTVRVAPDGSFALHLDPGKYSIEAAPPVFQGAVEPSSVLVPQTGSLVLRLRIVRSP